MEFSPYIWQLYKNSPEGSLAIQVFSNLFERILGGNFNLPSGNAPLNISNWTWEFTKIVVDDYTNTEIANIDEAEKVFNEIAGGFPVTFYDDDGKTEDVTLTHADLLGWLAELSVGLYTRFPEYFFPYFFRTHFYLFEQICATFNIPLPELPKKKHFDKRLMYYFQLCQVLYEFRRNRNLSPAELCAFLYSFAPNFISLETDDSLPKPMKVWIVGGGIDNNGDPEFLDNADDNTISNWQGNIDTRRGDIVLVYCLAPRSSIHSVWRAKTDGFIDPFIYYYSQIWVCSPIKVAPVTYEDLRNDPLLSQNGLVRSSMQGLNGRRFTYHEYEAILKIMERKGQDTSALPKIEPLLDMGDDETLLKDERDVEIHLVEPLLEKLGYETGDWTRQMVVRMGSGEKIYPDYAFFAKQNKGEEQAKMVLEAKYRLKTQKELFKAYWQAKSYALRLEASIFIIAAIEGIWIFGLTKTGFDFEKHEHKTWQEIYQPDIFPNLLDLIGKQTIKKRKGQIGQKSLSSG
jgi:hypothetical protein